MNDEMMNRFDEVGGHLVWIEIIRVIEQLQSVIDNEEWMNG